EAAHQRAWQHVEALREGSHGRDARRDEEQRLEEAPTIVWHRRQVEREQADGLSLNFLAARRCEIVAKLAPSVCLANIDELPHSCRAKRQHRVWRGAIELREQRDGRHTRKLAYERCDARPRALIAARHRDDDGTRAIGFEILYELGDG